MGVSDYAVTAKGQAFLDAWPDSAARVRLSDEAVELLGDVESQRKPIYTKGLQEALAFLERQGFIERVYTDVDALLQSLKNNETRRSLSTYTRIAREQPVSNEEVDALYKRMRRALVTYDPEIGEGDPTYDTVVNLFNTAKTRSDKVIAIDSLVSLYHASSRDVVSGPFLGKDEPDPEDTVRIQRLLNRLGGS